MAASFQPISLDVMPPAAELARDIVRAYMFDVASRYYGRPATGAELDAALTEMPSDDLVLPHGLLLVAHRGGVPLGCAGLRFLSDGVGEVTRVFVAHEARGLGLGERLMRELERRARARQVTTLRLDTRADLVEARRLYARLGYDEVPAFNAGPYADHWFAKSLG